jgi:hypothetical protein
MVKLQTRGILYNQRGSKECTFYTQAFFFNNVLSYIKYCCSKPNTNNKPKAEVHPGHKLTGPKEEEEEEEEEAKY